MPQHTLAPRICGNCDGFATATVTTGAHHADGTRKTLPVDCPACKGTGRTLPASAPASALVRR
ncbi:hypothetical protein [Streptomyces sp. NPDC005012]|uniref:hypothetical protein n=1 Tax=Streptomyces sp. NPDC005012 TaxID=3154558 RepID=UPI0033A77B7B